MQKSLTMIAVALILSVGLVVAAGRIVGAEGDQAAAQPLQSPLLLAVPYEQQTKYEYDAFRTGEIDSTTTTTRSVIVIREDGSMSIKHP